jgi:hypothetical protein
MVHLRFKRRLTIAEFEAVLHSYSPITKASNGWTNDARAQGLFFDFSNTEFAEFACLGRSAVLVEGAIRHNIRTRIALPLETISSTDLAHIEHLRGGGDHELAHYAERAPLRRQRLKRFMEVVGFLSAIRLTHLSGIEHLLSIEDNFDTKEQSDSEERHDAAAWSDYNDEGAPPYFLGRVFPLKWFDRLDASHLRQSSHFLEAIVAFEHLGLSTVDSHTIARVVLQELVDNVSRHAGHGDTGASQAHALVGAIALGRRYRIDAGSSYSCLKGTLEIVNSHADRNHPIVAIFVGDSGAGITQTLGPHFRGAHIRELPTAATEWTDAQRVCIWSLTPWSTREQGQPRWKRGARGLWRVRQVLKRYGGFITLRTANVLGGWSYARTALGECLLEPRQLRYSVVTSIDFCFFPGMQRTFSTQPTQELSASAGEPLEYQVLTIDRLAEDGVLPRDRERLTDCAAQLNATEGGCIVAVIADTETSSPRFESLESLLNLLSLLALKGAFILVFPGPSSGEMRSAADSLEIYLDKTQNHHRYPVLFLDTYGEAHWLGARPEVRSILDRLFEGRKSPSRC